MTGLLERIAGTEWTVDSLAEAGLNDLPGWELLDGRLVRKVSKHFPHVDATDLFFRALDAVFASAEWRVLSEAPIRLNDRSEPEPDVSVVSRIASRERRTARAEEVRLAVEVSYTTQDDDFGDRLKRCARAGIVEYWVVDVSGNGVLHVYTEPEGEGYLRHRLVVGDDEVPYVGRSLRAVLQPSFE